jgi:hypothetical protein
MHFSRTIERTFGAGERPSVRVTLVRGALNVRGEDRGDIQVTATLHIDSFDRDGEEQLQHIDVPIEQHDDEVVIGPAEYDEDDEVGGGVVGLFFGLARRPRVDIDVRVPWRCAVHTTHRVGPTAIEGVRAPVHAESRTGRVRVSDVEGPVAIEGRTGQVEVHDVRGPVSVDSRTGRVDLRDVTGEVSCSARTGAVQLRDCPGPFRIASRTGAVAYEGPVTHNGDIEVHTGTITLAVPRDAAFFLDAESMRGSVRSELSVDGGRGEPPADAPTVRLRASTGTIRITAR